MSFGRCSHTICTISYKVRPSKWWLHMMWEFIVPCMQLPKVRRTLPSSRKLLFGSETPSPFLEANFMSVKQHVYAKFDCIKTCRSTGFSACRRMYHLPRRHALRSVRSAHGTHRELAAVSTDSHMRSLLRGADLMMLSTRSSSYRELAHVLTHFCSGGNLLLQPPKLMRQLHASTCSSQSRLALSCP